MKPKKILITGGAGFIGSAFVRLTHALGMRLIVIDKLTYAGDMQRISGLGNIRFYKTDIRNKKAIADIFSREKPDTVVNFAAETHVDRSIADSEVFITTNIGGVHVLMEAARKAGTKRFIHISTDEVYGEIAQGAFRETHQLAPNSPYAASKASADMLVKSYIRTYGFPAIIVRPSNNFGPWQYPEKLIPVVITRAMQNQSVPVYAKGLNVREWLFVDDSARAILAVMTQGKLGECYNIGSGNERRNIDVVTAILDILEKPRSLIRYVADRPGHDLRYALDCAKVKKLGWKPRIDFNTGLHQTVQWYLQYRKWVIKKLTVS